MVNFRVTMTATALVLALAAARADPYVGTDDDGNLQLRSAQGQGVFTNIVDLVQSHPVFFPSVPRPRTPQATGFERRSVGGPWIQRGSPTPFCPQTSPWQWP